MTDKIQIRSADPGDALHLARFINAAGGGMSHYFWQTMVGDDGDPWTYGAQRALTPGSPYYYQLADMAMIDDQVAGCIITYQITEAATAADYEDIPAIFQPLQRLEDAAVGTHYISVLSIYPDYQGRGIGRYLAERAIRSEHKDTTLIVSDDKAPAIGLYQSLGFQTVDRQPVVKEGWQTDARYWLLMRRPA